MAQYAPLRDAFNDLTKLLVDKQEWDSKQAADKEQRGLDRMITESHLQDAALRRKSAERQAMRDTENMKEIEVNIYDAVPNNDYTQTKLFDTGSYGTQYAQLIGGSSVDRATGRVLDANGQVLKLPRFIASERMAQGYGVVSQALDPEEMINANLTTIDTKLVDMEKQLRSIPISDVANRKQLKERISEAKTTRNQHISMMEPEQLLPLYRQRQQHLDKLIMQVASTGGDPAVLQSLQGAAQRVNSDLLSVQQRKMQADLKKEELAFRAEDKKEERQFRREEKIADRAARKEEAALKLEAAKVKGGGQPAVKFAIQKDKDGNIINSVSLNVPKDRPSLTINEVDPRLDPAQGWEFAEQDDQITKNQKGSKLSAPSSYNILEENFKMSDENGLLGRQIPDANLPRLAAANRVLGTTLKNSANEAQAAARARDIVITAERAYWEEYEDSIRGLTSPSAIAAAIAPLEEEFAGDFGYKPNPAHRQSLDLMQGQLSVK